MGIVVRGRIPEGMDEIGLQHLARLALAVGVGSASNAVNTQIHEYAEKSIISQESLDDERIHRLNFLVGLYKRDLACLIEDGNELEDEINSYFEDLGLHYEVTDTG